MKKGVSKYGKLEDFNSYEEYKAFIYKAKHKVANEKYVKTEKGKLASSKKYSKYKKGNGRLLCNFNNNNRRSAKLKRTPKWANLEDIKSFYKSCPKGYQVDHIIPLLGKNVSGLHVLNNLQYLTPEENLSKGNRYEHQ